MQWLAPGASTTVDITISWVSKQSAQKISAAASLAGCNPIMARLGKVLYSQQQQLYLKNNEETVLMKSTHNKSTTSVRGLRVLALTGMVATAIGLQMPSAQAMYEDLKVAETGPHSTFHYELTRLLAKASGFSTADAELIAVAAEATDRMIFTGTAEGSPTVELAGTERMDETKGEYFHWPRRGVNNSTSEYQQPGGRDTCAYFTKSNADKCVNGKPEVDTIEQWAVFNVGTPAVGAPVATVNGGTSAPVQGGSLLALGIYTHALADTYTHEPCMKKKQIRTHMGPTSLTVTECSTIPWHQDEEFGPEASNLGTKFTKEGGLAVWKALNYYRQNNGLSEPALLSEQEVMDYINTWSEIEDENERSAAAEAAYEGL
jgi:hypothetical protein